MTASKEEKVKRVEESVLAILAAEGESKLTISRLAKRAKVSRPWIYKQFGSCVNDLLFFSTKVVGERFSKNNDLRLMRTLPECWDTFYEGAGKTLDELETWPWIPKIYFDYVDKPGPIGMAIREIEKIYVARLAAAFGVVTSVSPEKAEAVALSFVKVRLATAHAWVHDERMRKAGRAAALELMMLPFAQLGYAPPSAANN